MERLKAVDRSSKVPATVRRTTYMYFECQKNHALETGGYVLDGCQEFKASGT